MIDRIFFKTIFHGSTLPRLVNVKRNCWIFMQQFFSMEKSMDRESCVYD